MINLGSYLNSRVSVILTNGTSFAGTIHMTGHHRINEMESDYTYYLMGDTGQFTGYKIELNDDHISALIPLGGKDA